MTIKELTIKLELSYKYYSNEFEESIKKEGAGLVNGMLNLGYAEAFKSILEEIYKENIPNDLFEGVK